MSTISTKRKARDLVLDLLTDVNDRQKFRMFKLIFNLEDDTEFQIANDVLDAFTAHNAPVISFNVRSVLGENHGVQKVKSEFIYFCRIDPDVK
jgi:hypothetical protein